MAQQHQAHVRIVGQQLKHAAHGRAGRGRCQHRLRRQAVQHALELHQQLVLDAVQKLVHVCIMQIKRTAVDIAFLAQFLHRDILNAFFPHQTHQPLPQLPARFPHAAVCGVLCHGLPSVS